MTRLILLTVTTCALLAGTIGTVGASHRIGHDHPPDPGRCMQHPVTGLIRCVD